MSETEAPKNKGGRPPHEPTEKTRQQVKTLAGYGIPQDGIAKLIGISEPTLQKHYREELDVGMVEANSLVVQSLFKKATGTGPASVTAAIFWLKCRARWREDAEGERGDSEMTRARRIKAALDEIESLNDGAPSP